MIITIPVHIKKLHHTKTIYKIIEKPVHAGLWVNYRPQTTAPGEPDRGRPHGWYDGGGGETAQGADADSHEAQRPPSHDDHGNAGTSAAATSSHGPDFAPGGRRGRGGRGGHATEPHGHGGARHHKLAGESYGPHKHRGPGPEHKPRGAATVIHVIGDHKHGHYAGVTYAGPGHEPGPVQKHAHVKPAYYGAGARPPKPAHAARPPGNGAQTAPGRNTPARFPVVVPPPPRPQHRGPNASPPGGGAAAVLDGGYQVQENVVDTDDWPPPTARGPSPYVTAVGPAAAGQHATAAAGRPSSVAVSSPQAASAPQQTAFASQQTAFAPPPPQTAVSHVYYTLDPVVPYGDIARPSTK